MLNEITDKLKQTIKRFSERYGDQVNLASESTQSNLADEIVRDIWDTDITMVTENKDQLELFSNIEQDLHK